MSLLDAQFTTAPIDRSNWTPIEVPPPAAIPLGAGVAEARAIRTAAPAAETLDQARARLQGQLPIDGACMVVGRAAADEKMRTRVILAIEQGEWPEFKLEMRATVAPSGGAAQTSPMTWRGASSKTMNIVRVKPREATNGQARRIETVAVGGMDRPGSADRGAGGGPVVLPARVKPPQLGRQITSRYLSMLRAALPQVGDEATLTKLVPIHGGRAFVARQIASKVWSEFSIERRQVKGIRGDGPNFVRRVRIDGASAQSAPAPAAANPAPSEPPPAPAAPEPIQAPTKATIPEPPNALGTHPPRRAVRVPARGPDMAPAPESALEPRKETTDGDVRGCEGVVSGLEQDRPRGGVGSLGLGAHGLRDDDSRELAKEEAGSHLPQVPSSPEGGDGDPTDDTARDLLDCWQRESERVLKADIEAAHEAHRRRTHINGPYSWATNPWVWVVEFRRLNP